MRRRIWTSALAALVVILVAAAGGAAATKDDDSGLSAARFAKIDPTLLESTGPHGAFVPASLSDTPVSVMVQFTGDPVAVQDGSAKQHGQKLSGAQKDAIR